MSADVISLLVTTSQHDSAIAQWLYQAIYTIYTLYMTQDCYSGGSWNGPKNAVSGRCSGDVHTMKILLNYTKVLIVNLI